MNNNDWKSFLLLFFFLLFSPFVQAQLIGDPQLGFKIDLPAGWQYELQGESVMLANPERAGLVIVSRQTYKSLAEIKDDAENTNYNDGINWFQRTSDFKSIGNKRYTAMYEGVFAGGEIMAVAVFQVNSSGPAASVFFAEPVFQFSAQSSQRAVAIADRLKIPGLSTSSKMTQTSKPQRFNKNGSSTASANLVSLRGLQRKQLPGAIKSIAIPTNWQFVDYQPHADLVGFQKNQRNAVTINAMPFLMNGESNANLDEGLLRTAESMGLTPYISAVTDASNYAAGARMVEARKADGKIAILYALKEDVLIALVYVAAENSSIDQQAIRQFLAGIELAKASRPASMAGHYKTNSSYDRGLGDFAVYSKNTVSLAADGGVVYSSTVGSTGGPGFSQDKSRKYGEWKMRGNALHVVYQDKTAFRKLVANVYSNGIEFRNNENETENWIRQK